MSKTLSFQQIIQALKKKEYAPVYFLHGEESYYIDEIAKYIETNVLDESMKAFNQTILYGKEIDHKTVLDNARRYPVMSDKQVLIVREAQELKSIEQLEGYINQALETTILVICYKHKKIDGRKPFAKTLKQSKNVILFESNKLYENQVPTWISNHLKEKNINIKPAACNLLAEYLGTDLSKIANELEKLTINLPQGQAIDRNIIQKNIGISKDFNVFELQAALGKKDNFKCLLIVKYFSSNPQAHPIQMIVGTLYNYFSKVYITQSMTRSSDRELSKVTGINQFFIKDYRTAATNYSKNEIEQVFSILRTFDVRSKGVNNYSTDQSELLKEMILSILN